MPPQPDRFAEKLRRALQRSGMTEDLRYDKENFALQYPGGTMYLSNAYEEYCRASFFSRPGVVRRWVLSSKEQREVQTPDSFAGAQANLLPIVRDAAYFDYIRLMQRSKPGGEFLPLANRPLGADLVLGLAHDSPRTIATLAQKTVDDWGVSLDDGLKAAQFNLRARSPNGLSRHAPGVFVSPYQDNYDAARIVLTEVISRLEVRGDPVALVPHRDALIVSGSDDPEGLVVACNLAEPLLKENRRISGSAVVFRNGRWEEFMAPVGSPAHEPLRRLRMRALMADYGQQEELLQKIEGDGIFVASYQVVEADGRWSSYSVWSEGVPTSLPRSEKVFLHSERFAEGDPRRGLKDWSALERAAGSLMEKQDLHPGRVMVREFPSDEMIEAAGRP